MGGVCSLADTCELKGVEPYGNLHDVLTRMVDGHPVSRLDELLPSTWKARDSVKSPA
jgi:transposase